VGNCTPPAIYKIVSKTYKKHLEKIKNSAIFAAAFRTTKATFLEKKVKNKFGMRVKKLLSLPSVQKRKGD